MIKRFLFALTWLSAFTASARQRPNIIYIMCDDMGYGDLGCYGQPFISTPRIDRMAAEGMRFTQAYAGSPVSAPSRATVMTGQHTGHTHVRGNKEYWNNACLQQNLYGQNADYTRVGQEPYDPQHLILPEIFKQAGYATGMFGKWAGGYEGSHSTPDKRGIDEFYGYICQFQAHLYYPNFLNRFSSAAGDKEVVREVLEQNIQFPMFGEDYAKRAQYSADLIHQHALDWLDKQEEGKPFLGIFTYTLPHAELYQPRDSILLSYEGKLNPEKAYKGDQWSRYNANNNSHAQFAAMITRLDTQVGEILDKLREKGLDDNTIVIFTSDNGPHEEGGADPEFFGRDGKLRGLKRSTYEGGIRIPFIVRWPGKVKGGQESDQQIIFYDLLPTFCDLAGIKGFPQRFLNPRQPDDCFDGLSFAPTLTGKGKQKAHDHLYWEFHETDMFGVRHGDWKLIVQRGKCRLYNLATDIHEDRDVAAQHPDVVRELVRIIYREHRDSPLFRVTLPPSPDEPRMSWRGLLIDSGRQYQSLRTLRRLIDTCASLGMNRLHWHLTEGLGWRVEIPSMPLLTQVGAFVGKGPEQQGYYSAKEIRALVKYAAKRGVEIVPEIDIPGHAEAALAAYPSLGCRGTAPAIPETGFTDNIFCAGNDSTLAALRRILDTVCELFPSEYIHLGGDEAPKGAWHECPRCQARIRELGLKNEADLQLWLSAEMAKYLKQKGRRAIFWEDVLGTDATYPLPQDAVIQWWNYRVHGHRGLDRALARGHQVICSPNYYTYLNFPTEPWRGYGKDRTFTLDDARLRNPADSVYGTNPLIIGMTCALWTDYGLTEDMIDSRLFPRINTLAEQMLLPKQYRTLPK